MERSEIRDAPKIQRVGGLKLFGISAASDETVTTAVKRQHEPQRIIGDLLATEINENQPRTPGSPRDPDRVGWRMKDQLTIAKLPFAPDPKAGEIDELVFANTPIP